MKKFGLLLFLSFFTTLASSQWQETNGVVSLVNSGDDIGIGTNNPSEKLHLQGAAIFEDIVEPSNFLKIGTGSNNSYLDARGAGSLEFKRNGITGLRLRNDDGSVQVLGQLRVGNSPVANGYIASFEGKVVATEVTIDLQSDWPDYVFGDDYKLLSVQQQHDFIKENGHLHNMPRAFEIEDQGGITIGVMNLKLIEKIEELTLYILQQQEQLAQLELEYQKMTGQ